MHDSDFHDPFHHFSDQESPDHSPGESDNLLDQEAFQGDPLRSPYDSHDPSHFHPDESHAELVAGNEFTLADEPVAEMSEATHSVTGASQFELLSELLQGRQVCLHEEAAGNTIHGDLLDRFEGKPVFVREIETDTPDGPLLIIAASHDPEGATVSVPIESFLHDDHGASYNYSATDTPSIYLGENSHDFDPDRGFFTTAFDWMAAETPKFMTSIFAFFVGEGVGELFDSHAATFVGHFATEKIIDNISGGQTKENHSESETGVAAMSGDDKLELMRKI